VGLAQELAAWVRADARFEIMAPATLNLVCFRLKADDAANERLLQALNASGKIYLSHTKLNGQFVLRLSVGQTYTEEEHVRSAWEQIKALAKI